MTGTSSRSTNSARRAIKAGLMGMIVAPFLLSASAQQVSPAGTATPANPQRAVPFVANSPSAPHKPGSEGITIHGHWVMDVVNRDGTVAQHRDFENALAGSQGSSVLARVLNGTLLTQQFIVALSGGGNVAFLYVPAQSCPRFLASGSTVFCANNLTQGLIGGTSIVLQGTFTATTPVTFQTVATDVGTCPQVDPGPVTYSPAICQANTNGPIPGAGGAYVGTYNFTAATIPDLAVAAGQSVVVTVTISFS